MPNLLPALKIMETKGIAVYTSNKAGISIAQKKMFVHFDLVFVDVWLKTFASSTIYARLKKGGLTIYFPVKNFTVNIEFTKDHINLFHGILAKLGTDCSTNGFIQHYPQRIEDCSTKDSKSLFHIHSKMKLHLWRSNLEM